MAAVMVRRAHLMTMSMVLSRMGLIGKAMVMLLLTRGLEQRERRVCT
uniref:Uncharacterized protein n=1 Tax=Arundo donax TaxID=35708 RepID=A0A0A9G5E9_ARUDO